MNDQLGLSAHSISLLTEVARPAAEVVLSWHRHHSKKETRKGSRLGGFSRRKLHAYNAFEAFVPFGLVA